MSDPFLTDREFRRLANRLIDQWARDYPDLMVSEHVECAAFVCLGLTAEQKAAWLADRDYSPDVPSPELDGGVYDRLTPPECERLVQIMRAAFPAPTIWEVATSRYKATDWRKDVQHVG